MSNADLVRAEVKRLKRMAKAQGQSVVRMRSINLGRELGLYGKPGKPNNLPNVCRVMKEMMGVNDVIVQQPPSGQGDIIIEYQV
jgi:hypothetical protein